MHEKYIEVADVSIKTAGECVHHSIYRIVYKQQLIIIVVVIDQSTKLYELRTIFIKDQRQNLQGKVD